MTPRSISIAVAGLLGMFVVGCAGESDSTTQPTEAVVTSTSEGSATVAPLSVDQYLLHGDEGPGLKPLSPPQTVSGEPFPLPEGGAAMLEHSGYISTTYQTGQGDGIAGVSSVLLFETGAGARDWMVYETSDEVLRHELPDGKFTWFEVPDVPGATGWTGPDMHGNAIGNVYWTQGRCMMLISIETDGRRVEPLSAGAQAVFERTGGTCPNE